MGVAESGRTESGGAKRRARAAAAAAKARAKDAAGAAKDAVGAAKDLAGTAKDLASTAKDEGPKASAREAVRMVESTGLGDRARTAATSWWRQRQPADLPARARAAGPDDRPIITVVVIVYKMRDQAMRTLFTLSAAYQRDVSPFEYEVLVIENASGDNLDPRAVQRLGPNFRYHRRTETGVSPTPAINEGLALARGEFIGLMVDGARMVTPGVLRNALDVFRIDRDAVVAAPGYHIGFDDHMFREDAAHSLAQDRRLLAGIPWRRDGYYLFDISIMSGANPFGYLHPMGESNCMFASRDAYEAVGGADPRFDLPGGGMVNLDLYCELLRRPESTLYLMPGEGSFHQFHGGVTTQKDDDRAGLMAQFNANYFEIRGTTYFAPRKEPCFIGTMHNRALPALAYSAVEGRSHFEHWARRAESASQWVDDPVVPAPDILNSPPGSPVGEEDVSIYLPPSVRKFEPKHLTFSTWADHIQFGYDIVEAVRPALLVELGTQGGLSYFTFCQSMKENDIEGLCYAVDTWEGEEHTGKYDDTTWNMVSNHNRENYPGFSYLMRMFFSEAVQHFADDSIDLLHIDGLHTYDAVKDDFDTWYAKVAPGGIILFHDIKARLKDFGVWRFWDEIEAGGEYETFAFKHGFGLGVLRKPGGDPAETELTELLFNSTPGEQAQLRRFYEHAAYFHHVKRRSDRAMELGLL